MISFLGKEACHFKYNRMNKKFSLKNKTAVVTGGGSGIGEAISLTLASQDAFVHVLDNQFESALETVNDIKKITLLEWLTNVMFQTFRKSIKLSLKYAKHQILIFLLITLELHMLGI